MISQVFSSLFPPLAPFLCFNMLAFIKYLHCLLSFFNQSLHLLGTLYMVMFWATNEAGISWGDGCFSFLTSVYVITYQLYLSSLYIPPMNFHHFDDHTTSSGKPSFVHLYLWAHVCLPHPASMSGSRKGFFEAANSQQKMAKK